MKQVWEDRRREHGFTLTELLVVIVILAILAGVVVFAVGGISDKGQQSACDTDKKSVETAQEAYNAKNNAYAANVGALVTAKFLRETSKWYQTNNAGTVTAIAGNPGKCT